VACTPKEIDFDQIICQTQAASGNIAGTITVTVNSDGQANEASCPNNNCDYEFSPASSPSVDAPANPVTEANAVLTLTGSGLDSATVVTLGDGECTIQTATASELTCNVGSPSAGSQTLKVLTPSGFSNAVQVTVEGSVDSATPVEGSTAGGTEIVLAGFGFDVSEDGTTVTVDGAACEITAITGTSVTCDSPAHAAGAVDVVVTSNDVALDAVNFTYSDAATPTMSSIAPTSGVPGDEITITGKSKLASQCLLLINSSQNIKRIWFGRR
jgi:hypothetical protein